MYNNKVSSLLKITKEELTYYKNGVKDIVLNGDREIREFVYNINDNIEKYKPQLLIYSPKISTGVSIDIIHYDKVIYIADNKSACARSLIQMLFRVRILKDKTMNIYIAGEPHRPNNKFNFNFSSNILNDMKHQLDKYNNETIKILTDFNDVEIVKKEQNHYDYDNSSKNLDDNYIELRTYNLLEKLKTSNIFIQDFFKFCCINHGFRLNYIELKEEVKSDFKEKKDAGKYDKALLYQKIELITPVKYIQYKELMKSDKWADKSPYE